MEATLFVGRPEQPYFWTDGLREQERDFRRETKVAERSIERISKDLIIGFLGSDSYHGSITPLELRQIKDPRARPTLFAQTTISSEHIELAKVYPKWTNIVEKGARGRGRTVPPAFVAQLKTDLSTLASIPLAKILNEILDLIGSSIGSQRTVIGVLLTALGTSSNTNVAVSTVLSRIDNPFFLFGEVWSGKEPSSLDEVKEELAPRVKRANIDNRYIDPTAKWLFYNRSAIPVTFKALLDYLKTDPLTSFAVRQKTTTIKWPLNPRMKPFRAYHLLSSFEDIIENQISVTRGAMWNGVAIAKGSNTPLKLWADDGIVRDDRILRYFSEPNADIDIFNVGQSETTPFGDFTANSYLVGFSRIAQGLRPMYRGQLVCRGRPDIHPWDICHVWDHYRSIFGPIEVEGVTHHYSSETGFISTITPHCVAIANNHLDSWEVMKQSWTLGGIALGSVLLTGALAAGLFIPGAGLVIGAGLSLGIGVGAKTIADTVLEEITGVGISGNFHGVGQVGGLRTPVKIIPLQRMGTPWVAALRGWGRDSRKATGGIIGMAYERLSGAVSDVWGGVKGITGITGELSDGFDDINRRGEGE
jgi:hypothetical protein